MIDSHSVLGLGLAALIYIVSITEAFNLFVPEMTLWEDRGVVTASTITPDIAARAAENAEARLEPGNEILNVVLYAPDEIQPSRLSGSTSVQTRKTICNRLIGWLIPTPAHCLTKSTLPTRTS